MSNKNLLHHMYTYVNKSNTTSWIELEFRKVALRGNDGEEGKNGVPIPR